MRAFLSSLFLLALSLPAGAQRVAGDQNHHRVWSIDRVVVSQGVRMPAHAQGKLGFVALYGPVASGLCLVEYVSRNDQDFADLRAAAATDPQVLVFDKAFTPRAVFVTAAKAAGFTQLNLDKFFVKVP